MGAMTSDLIFVTNITNYIRGEKIAMSCQLSMYDNCGEIENFSTCGEISVQLIGFYCNLCQFVAKSAIHAVMSRNSMTKKKLQIHLCIPLTELY